MRLYSIVMLAFILGSSLSTLLASTIREDAENQLRTSQTSLQKIYARLEQNAEGEESAAPAQSLKHEIALASQALDVVKNLSEENAARLATLYTNTTNQISFIALNLEQQGVAVSTNALYTLQKELNALSSAKNDAEFAEAAKVFNLLEELRTDGGLKVYERWGQLSGYNLPKHVETAIPANQQQRQELIDIALENNRLVEELKKNNAHKAIIDDAQKNLARKSHSLLLSFGKTEWEESAKLNRDDTLHWVQKEIGHAQQAKKHAQLVKDIQYALAGAATALSMTGIVALPSYAATAYYLHRKNRARLHRHLQSDRRALIGASIRNGLVSEDLVLNKIIPA
jgi:hypothetical protein